MEGTARRPSARRYVVPAILCCVTQRQLELEHWMLQVHRCDFKFGLNWSNCKPVQKGAAVSPLDPPQVRVASLFLLPVHTDNLSHLTGKRRISCLSVRLAGRSVGWAAVHGWYSRMAAGLPSPASAIRTKSSLKVAASCSYICSGCCDTLHYAQKCDTDFRL